MANASLPMKPPPPRRRPITASKKFVFSLVTLVLVVGTAEVFFWLIGVRPVSETRDPLVGFTGNVPLMVDARDAEGRDVLITAANKRVWFNEQSFPREKPEETVRIFCLGGSTTYGRPYDDTTSYSGWLRELLPRIDPTRRWEVINAGGISYASYRVAAVMDELSRYDPDVFVVYTAHNEFLERRTYDALFRQSPLRRSLVGALSHTRSWAVLDRWVHRSPAGVPESAGVPKSVMAPDSAGAPGPEGGPDVDRLPAEVDEMLNHSVGPSDYRRDDRWQSGVLHHYELNLRRMIRIARGAGVKVVFVTAASNEKDCAPFKSEPTNETDRPDDTSRDASFHFRSGRELFTQARYDEAETAFRRAVDEDICPLRAISTINEMIRRVCDETDVPVVDFEHRLRSACQREYGHGCLGEEYFLDHVHPTIEVHGWLARWVAETLQRQFIVGGTPIGEAAFDPIFDQVRSLVNERVDPVAQGIAMRNLAKVYHWAGKFDEARRFAERGIERLGDDAECRFILADCLSNLGRNDEAIRQFEILFRTVDTYPKGHLVFAELLHEQERDREAEPFAIVAVAARPDDPRAHYVLGSIHLRLGAFDDAAASLLEADRLYPEDVETISRIAEARLGGGDVDEAIGWLRRATEIRPDDPAIGHRLGLAYLKAKRSKEAVEAFRDVLRSDPDHEPAAAALRVAESLP